MDLDASHQAEQHGNNPALFAVFSSLFHHVLFLASYDGLTLPIITLMDCSSLEPVFPALGVWSGYDATYVFFLLACSIRYIYLYNTLSPHKPIVIDDHGGVTQYRDHNGEVLKYTDSGVFRFGKCTWGPNGCKRVQRCKL